MGQSWLQFSEINYAARLHHPLIVPPRSNGAIPVPKPFFLTTPAARKGPADTPGIETFDTSFFSTAWRESGGAASSTPITVTANEGIIEVNPPRPLSRRSESLASRKPR